jgi:hypothetical protein
MLSDGLSKNTYSDKPRAKPPFMCKKVKCRLEYSEQTTTAKFSSVCLGKTIQNWKNNIKYSFRETTTKGTDINSFKKW